MSIEQTLTSLTALLKVISELLSISEQTTLFGLIVILIGLAAAAVLFFNGVGSRGNS